MTIFSRRPTERVIHDKQVWAEPDFVAEYNSQVSKYNVDFQAILDYLATQIDPAQQANVLEIGPGPGWIGIRLAQSHPAVRVTGIDISAAMVEVAKANSQTEGVADRVTFTVGDAAEMRGLADSSFDVVFSFQSLHYWDPPERVFDQIARVLKPGGVLCIAEDRRDMNWQGKLQVLLGRFLLSRRIASVWARSVSGCLTAAEAADALQKSGLRDRWQIAIRPRAMLITSKPRMNG